MHKVSFQEAAKCIFSANALVLEDRAHSKPSEKRFNLISAAPSGRVLTVGFCKRQDKSETRIISARPSSRKERRKYFEAFGADVVFATIDYPLPKYRVRFIW